MDTGGGEEFQARKYFTEENNHGRKSPNLGRERSQPRSKKDTGHQRDKTGEEASCAHHTLKQNGQNKGSTPEASKEKDQATGKTRPSEQSLPFQSKPSKHKGLGDEVFQNLITTASPA